MQFVNEKSITFTKIPERSIFTTLKSDLLKKKKELNTLFSKTLFFLLYCCKKKLHKQQKTSVDLNIDDMIVILRLFCHRERLVQIFSIPFSKGHEVGVYLRLWQNSEKYRNIHNYQMNIITLLNHFTQQMTTKGYMT